MANNVDASTQPSWLQSLDYVLGSAQRVAEGVLSYKVLNSEANARAAQAQWQAAAYTQLAGNPGAAWSGAGGVGGIQLPGISQAGVAGASPLLAIGIGLAVAFALFKD